MEQILAFIQENLLLVILGTIGVICLIFVIVLVIIANRKDNREQQVIIANLTTPRIFVLNFTDGQVTYFDRGVYTNRKVGPLSHFYHQFMAREVEKLEAWVESLLTPKSGAPLAYKVDVFVKSEKRSYASILEVSKIDYEKRIIHLESYLYRYLRPNYQMNTAIKKKENIGYLGSSALLKLYKRRYLRISGVYGALKLFNRYPKKQENIDIPTHLIYEMQNQTAFYRSRKRIIRLGTSATVGIYMPRSIDEGAMIDVLTKIMRRMEAYLEINGYEDYTLAAGIVRSKEFSDINMGIKTAEELSAHAFKSENKILIYDPNNEVKARDLSLYRNEIKQIISRKSVDPLFQPVVVTENAEIYGYITSYVTKSPLFASFAELATFARENNQNEALIHMVLRKSAASYYNVRRNVKQKLFIPLEVDEVPFISEAFSKQPFANDLRFVFMISDQNFSEHFVTVDEMLNVITSIKRAGYEITLIITETELTLPDDIYSEVDYFMVNEEILTYTVSDERERLYLLSTLGKLLRHKKPIAITGLAKWSEIEYYVRAGVDLVASDEISKKDGNVLTIEKKKALRIRNFSKR